MFPVAKQLGRSCFCPQPEKHGKTELLISAAEKNPSSGPVRRRWALVLGENAEEQGADRFPFHAFSIRMSTPKRSDKSEQLLQAEMETSASALPIIPSFIPEQTFAF